MSTDDPGLEAPPLTRRFACFLYEGVLLFGVVFVVALAYGVATQQRNGLQGRSGLLASLFTAIGLYFVWCWTRSGQTLPMQTWHIRLVGAGGEPVATWRATLRYIACWLWFVPGLWASHLAALQSTPAYIGAVMAWIGFYAALSLVLPQRQFLHDLLCGTRLVTFRRPSRR